MAPPPAHSAGSQQRASQGPAAALLDQFEGRGSGDKQVRDWYGDRGGSGGGNDQPGMTVAAYCGSTPVSTICRT